MTCGTLGSIAESHKERGAGQERKKQYDKTAENVPI